MFYHVLSICLGSFTPSNYPLNGCHCCWFRLCQSYLRVASTELTKSWCWTMPRGRFGHAEMENMWSKIHQKLTTNVGKVGLEYVWYFWIGIYKIKFIMRLRQVEQQIELFQFWRAVTARPEGLSACCHQSKMLYHAAAWLSQDSNEKVLKRPHVARMTLFCFQQLCLSGTTKCAKQH